MALKDKEKRKAYNKQKWQRYYLIHREELNRKRRERWQWWYPEHKGQLLDATKRCNRAVKIEVLTHYGNGKFACVKCGFGDIRALTLDHINGGGYQERKKIGGAGGVNLYYLLRKQGYPEGYQTLCMNCQFIKRVENKEYPYKS